MTTNSQFLHLGTARRVPRKGDPKWACVAGITAEGARIPGSSNHVPYPKTPAILFGVSPVEAGNLAIERGDQARDAKGRRLRRDGVVLLSGVVSYPVLKTTVLDDQDENETYRRWRREVVEWLKRTFGDHLKSIVEHVDEDRPHLHFYVVPALRADRRLDLDEIHPGRRMKRAAAEAGAKKKVQDAAYRRAMEMWQDDFFFEISRHFGHERYLPKRARVTRQERQAQKRVEKDAARRRAELELAQVEFEAEMAARRSELALAAAELERSAAQTRAEIAHQREMLERRKAETEADLGRKQAKMIEVARGNAWRAFGQPLQEMRAAHQELQERCRAVEAEAERLQARLDELEPDLSWRAVA